ncbi:MAG: hypothetical protein AAF907_02115 [Planctomycetota bacterium]
MFEFLQSVPSNDLIPVLAIVGAFFTGIVIAVPAIVGHYWITFDRNRRGAELAAEMLANGWGPEQVREVLDSTFASTDRPTPAPSAVPQPAPAALSPA